MKRKIAAMTILMTVLLTSCFSQEVKKPVSNKRTPKETVETDETVEIEDDRLYATDYDLEDKGHTTVLDKWRIWKHESNGYTELQIMGSYKNDPDDDPMDHLVFKVYDSAEIAQEMYENLYERSMKNGGGSQAETGDYWFVSEEPDVCDATIVWIVCVQDNVVIMADLEVWSEWVVEVDETEETQATTAAPRFDRSKLKDYVIDNAPEIRDYVINVILEG